MRTHEHRTAAGLFALLVLIYLWPALTGGDVLSPAAVLYGFPPWHNIAPPDVLHRVNVLLIDPPTSYYPWDVLGRQLLHAGTFPAWNSHAFAGTPLYANLSIAWLSPFSLPLWTLPLHYALGLSAALKLWVAGFGTYLLVRELRLGFWPGIVAGIAFALCAFNLVWLSHGAQVSVSVLLPWLVWLTERIVRRGGQREGVALAVVVACALAGGHPGTQVHVLAATVLYAIVRTGLLTDVPARERALRLATVGGGLLVGVLLMAVILLPGERAAVDAVGSAARRGGGTDTLIGGKLPLESLLAAVLPDRWGRPSEALVAGPANYNERAFFAGSLTLVFAVLALLSAGAWRRKAAFAVLAAIGLAVPLNAPLIRPLVVHLPGFDRVQDQRMLLWFAFAAAVLAAFGVDQVLAAPRRQRRAWAIFAVALVGGVWALSSMHPASGDVSAAFHHFTDRFAARTPGSLGLAASLRWLLIVLLGAGALLLLRVKPERPWLAGGAIALVVALDMLLFVHAFQPMAPASQVFPPRTASVAYLQRHARDGRIAGLEGALPSDWSTTYGLRDARGYDAPQPSRRFYRLWRVLTPDQQEWRPFQVAGLSRESLGVLGLLGVRYVVAEAGSQTSSALTRAGLGTAYRGSDATVFENARAAPRALVAPRVHVAHSEDDEIATVAEEGFDPRRTVIVRASEVGRAVPSGTTGSARVVHEENASVTLRATLAHPGLVLLDDASAPGWSVTVDGRPARALQADVVMRGVTVPAGSHEIIWSYRVPGLRLGALLSALGLLALLAWAGLLLVRARRAVR